MSDYWLGLLTLPVLTLGTFVLYFIWTRILFLLDDIGFSFEVKTKRNIEGISDYVLSHDIWWEHSRGPFFTGGWYREDRGYRLFNRWIAVGSTNGPCFMAFRKRNLGKI